MSGFQMVGTMAIAQKPKLDLLKTEPFEIRSSKHPDLDCFQILNGRILDLHCIQMVYSNDNSHTIGLSLSYSAETDG